jgi:hypothetical protein
LPKIINKIATIRNKATQQFSCAAGRVTPGGKLRRNLPGKTEPQAPRQKFHALQVGLKKIQRGNEM